MSDEIEQRLLDLVLEGVDRKNDDQEKRLEYIEKKHSYVPTMGKDVIHRDSMEIKPSVKEARDRIYESMKFEILDKLIRNWDNRSKRTMLLKDERDVDMSRPLMEGVKGASLVDKKYRSRGNEANL